MKLVGVQMDVQLGAVSQNTDRIIDKLRAARELGGRLVIFPECAITGYCHDSREQIVAVAEPIEGPAQQRLINACRELDLFCIVGLLEYAGELVFNTAVLLGPTGLIGSYRKVHLPFVGADRFTDHGDRPFAVENVGEICVGMNICYDAAFPEAARSLAVLGADLIALPTNWPPGAECMSPTVIATRAIENKVYYAAINRVGLESGVTFIGRSCICGPDGTVIASADPTEEKFLEATIDIEQTRNKWVIRQPRTHEIDRFADRRPEFYEPLTQPHTLVTPRQRLAGD